MLSMTDGGEVETMVMVMMMMLMREQNDQPERA